MTRLRMNGSMCKLYTTLSKHEICSAGTTHPCGRLGRVEQLPPVVVAVAAETPHPYCVLSTHSADLDLAKTLCFTSVQHEFHRIQTTFVESNIVPLVGSVYPTLGRYGCFVVFRSW